jgi:type II secretory pathway pseudopilin PulG
MRRADQAGFTCLALLATVVVMGIVLAALGQAWQAAAQREKEAQLLFAGHQMRMALVQYYQRSPPQAPRHPPTLEALLKDERSLAVRRYLRRIEIDPMTGKAEWGLVRDANGWIYGVHSLSAARPLKQGNFARADRSFTGAKSYSDWVFMVTAAQR